MTRLSKKISIIILLSVIVFCISLISNFSKPLTVSAEVTGTLNKFTLEEKGISYTITYVDDTGSDNVAKKSFEARINDPNVYISGSLTNLSLEFDTFFNEDLVDRYKNEIDYNYKKNENFVVVIDGRKITSSVNLDTTDRVKCNLNLGEVGYGTHTLVVEVHYCVSINGFFDDDGAIGYCQISYEFEFNELLDYSEKLSGYIGDGPYNGIYYYSNPSNFNFSWSHDAFSSGRNGFFNVRPNAYVKITNEDNGTFKEYTNNITELDNSYSDGTYLLQFFTTNNTLIASYNFCIDSIAPNITIIGKSSGNIYEEYTRFLPDDASPIKNLSFTRKMLSFDKEKIVVGDVVETKKDLLILTKTGFYTITVEDYLGNTATREVMLVAEKQLNDINLTKMQTTGYFNAGIYKVKIPFLREITIPKECIDGVIANYPGIYSNAKTYYFSNEELAIDFMVEIEIAASASKKWGGFEYKQINNSNVFTIYETSEDLRKAAKQYAKKSVQIVKETELGTIDTIYTDDSIVVMDDGVYKAETKDNNYTLIGGSFKFVNKNLSVNYNNTSYSYNSLSKLTIRYIDNKDNPIYNGDFKSNFSFADYIKSDAKDGVYEITETDSLGNTYSYNVYYDIISPYIEANYEYYELASDKQSSSIIEKAITIRNYDDKIETLIKSFKVNDIVDDVDGIVFARVECPNGNVITTRDFSKLKFGVDGYYTDGGEYRLKIYDRSMNYFEYVFIIAGPSPKVYYSYEGFGDNRKLVLEFSHGSTYSRIVDFRIYRYGQLLGDKEGKGLYQEKVDNDLKNEVIISEDVLKYKFYFGGEYTVKFIDNFNRVTTSEIIKFKKGLPTYTLIGVEDGGITNKAVSITFPNNIGYVLKRDGIVISGYGANTSDGYKVEIPATADNNGTWDIVLYVKSDENTKISIGFKMDTLPPIVQAVNADGKILAWDRCYNEPVKLTWDTAENVARCRYVIGNGYNRTYEKGELLSEDGVYVFTVVDEVGNTSSYTLEIDTSVNFKVDYKGSNYTENDIVYVSQGFTLENEENSLKLTVLRNGEQIDGKFLLQYTTEGSYTITLSDYMNNTITINIVIDKTAPAVSIVPTGNEYAPVQLELDANDIANYRFLFNSKNADLELKDNSEFTAWGSYSLAVSDKLGNSQTYAFEIAKVPPVIKAFDIDGKELSNSEQTSKGVYFTWDDKFATAKVSVSGGYTKAYTQNTLLDEEGVYTLTVVDAVNNKVSFTISVIKTISYAFITADNEVLKTVVVNGVEKTAEPFTISLNGELTVTVKKNTAPYSFTPGQQLALDGKYSFHIADSLGNYEDRTIIIDTTAPALNFTQGTDKTAPVKVKLNTVDVQSLTVVHKSISTEEEELFIEKEYEFSAWGSYTIIAKDALGNTSTVSFSITKKPPKVVIRTMSGKVLSNNAISTENVVIEYSEELIIKYVIDDSYAMLYKPEQILTEQGVYTITVTDLAENVYNYTLTLDSEIAFSTVVDGNTVKDFIDTQVGKRYIELTLKEPLTVVYSLNNSADKVVTETVTRFTDEGKYKFILKDNAGNSMVISFSLDRTAPTASIDTQPITKSDVVFTVSDLNDIDKYSVKKDGLSVQKFVLKKVNKFTDEGVYAITVQDNLGNKNVVDFEIKRNISYKLSVANGFIANGKVTLSLKEKDLTISAKLNGQAIELEKTSEFVFTNAGSYEITLKDKLGNVKVLSFILDETIYRKSFSFTIPRDSEITVKKDGEDFDIDKLIDGDTLNLSADGEYYIVFKKDGVTSTYTFTIDTVVPVLLLNGKEMPLGTNIGRIAYDFTIASSKKNASTITVYYNGDEVEYSAGDKLSAHGHYKVVITDRVGNIVEYEFERAFTFNAGAIMLFVMLGVGVAIIITLIIRRRIKMKIT